MQSLDVISVNIWQIIISLCNLGIMFLIVKKFLFKPVQKMLDARKAAVDKEYADAQQAKLDAQASRDEWDEKMKTADDKADEIIKRASENAAMLSDRIENEAKEKADAVIRRAHNEAELEFKRAQEGVKQQIADVSAAIAEKVLEREINDSDHRSLIDDFISQIGADDEGSV
ncbi:MAG: F0F1 ATP synthase subunit B [Oscillospiraceae bacterium]